MMGRTDLLLFLLLFGASSGAPADTTDPSELTLGVQAYQDERLKTALGHFIHVLEKEPSNHEAHTYVKLIIQKLEDQQVHEARETQVEILTATSKLFEIRHMDTRDVDQDLHNVLAAQAKREQDERHSKCSIASMEAQLGRLAAANALVLQVVAEDGSDPEAQRLLSQLQSQIRQALDSRNDLSFAERHTLEGFYAYGQADYASAVSAWAQARSLLEESFPPTEAVHQVALLYFEPYEKIAAAHLEQERQMAKARSLFDDGRAAYDKQDYAQSLDDFRQVALINPDYSQLGSYLVQSEAAVERLRTKNLTDEKRQEAGDAFGRGVADLEKGNYADAQVAFQLVLALDPNHPQAREYMKQIDTQKNRRVDPVAAQQHYEAGVIAYAGGDSEGAVREWHIAERLDPDNPKIAEAFHKGQKELVLSKELL